MPSLLGLAVLEVRALFLSPSVWSQQGKWRLSRKRVGEIQARRGCSGHESGGGEKQSAEGVHALFARAKSSREGRAKYAVMPALPLKQKPNVHVSDRHGQRKGIWRPIAVTRGGAAPIPMGMIKSALPGPPARASDFRCPSEGNKNAKGRKRIPEMHGDVCGERIRPFPIVNSGIRASFAGRLETAARGGPWRCTRRRSDTIPRICRSSLGKATTLGQSNPAEPSRARQPLPSPRPPVCRVVFTPPRAAQVRHALAQLHVQRGNSQVKSR